jgi:3-oxoacyl-[acyl-carrier protein] reductase
VRELHEHVVAILGPPTILINNAGTTLGLARVSSADQVSMEDFERTWRVNCGAAYLLAQLCLPAMEGEGWGRVVFVSSVAGITGGVVGPHYA